GGLPPPPWVAPRREHVEPDVVDHRVRPEALSDRLDEGVVPLRRQLLEMGAEDHGAQEGLELLSGLEGGRLLVEPVLALDEARRLEPPAGGLGAGEVLAALPEFTDARRGAQHRG